MALNVKYTDSMKTNTLVQGPSKYASWNLILMAINKLTKIFYIEFVMYAIIGIILIKLQMTL